jgi:hypothetical protein
MIQSILVTTTDGTKVELTREKTSVTADGGKTPTLDPQVLRFLGRASEVAGRLGVLAKLNLAARPKAAPKSPVFDEDEYATPKPPVPDLKLAVLERQASVLTLCKLAKDLVEPGEEGCNPEYYRALLNLVADAAGLTQDDHPSLAKFLGWDFAKLSVDARP